MSETDDLDLDQALGVWFDLERALEGKNGYGGDVAEIYAYRLVPPRFQHRSTVDAAEELAPLVGRNMTRLLRRFVELHEGAEIGIEDGPREFRAIDLRAEDFPPFAHRVHVRVTRVPQVRREFAIDLTTLWRRARDIGAHLPQPDFGTWDSATKFLLLALGMEGGGEARVIRGGA
jgi:hypothetical protein